MSTVVAALTRQELIATVGKCWTVFNVHRLRMADKFEASYLHLGRAKDAPDSDAGGRLQGLI